jgi:hypothetical protein
MTLQDAYNKLKAVINGRIWDWHDEEAWSLHLITIEDVCPAGEGYRKRELRLHREAFDYHEGWDFVVTRYIDEDNDPLTWRIEPEPRCDGDLVRDRMKGEYADIRECLLEIARELL